MAGGAVWRAVGLFARGFMMGSFAGIAVALFGLVPRAASLAWASLGGVFFLGLLGRVLQPPDWAMDLSPFNHVPEVPSEEIAAWFLIWLTVIATTLIAAGLVAFRRRDVG